MVQLANKLRSQYGSDYIVKELYKEALNYPNTIIESIRTVGEVLSLRDKPDFFLLATDAPLEVRYERSLKRNSVTDNISFEKFIEEENREMDCNDVNKQNLRKCINLADTVIENNGSIKDLEEKIDNLLKFNLKYTREFNLK
jgi:dephospho-CoA kinase